MKLRFALLALATLGGAALSTGTASAMPLAPLGQFQSSNVESVQWSAVRAVASAQGPCIGAGPTSSAAPMYVAAMDTIGAIVGTNLERGLRPSFFFLLTFGPKSACPSRSTRYTTLVSLDGSVDCVARRSRSASSAVANLTFIVALASHNGVP